MGTQKKIAQQIIDNGENYILALKGNHSELHDEVTEFLSEKEVQKYWNIAENTDCGHGHIEIRKCTSTEKIQWLGELQFPEQKSIFCIDSTRIIGDKETKER
jgi:predicted transposase YbfD/YdcC